MLIVPEYEIIDHFVTFFLIPVHNFQNFYNGHIVFRVRNIHIREKKEPSLTMACIWLGTVI